MFQMFYNSIIAGFPPVEIAVAEKTCCIIWAPICGVIEETCFRKLFRFSTDKLDSQRRNESTDLSWVWTFMGPFHTSCPF